jgi:two-component sensor histidine kinase
MWTEIANGRPRVCDLVAGVLQRQITCVDAPIGRGSRPDYAITVVFEPAAFGSIITRDNVGAGNIATLVDRSGRVIWRNAKADEFVGHSATGPMMRALRSGSDSKVLESVSLEGVPMLSAFDRSALSGWSVIVGSPLDQLKTASRQAIWWGSLVAFSILLLGAILAALLGARLVGAVNTLVHATDPDKNQEPAQPTGITEIDTVDAALRRSFAAKAESERHQQILIGELNHRVKNTLSIVQSLAHQTFRDAASPKEAISAFEARLQALAAAHNLLTKQRWEAASMAQVVTTALSPFCTPNRCRIEGPDLKVAPQTAVTLALALHELATNASKYGALRVDGGTIEVSWHETNGRFELLWEERGGPPVKAPKSEGFGMRLIKRSLAADLRGTVDMQFKQAGLRCSIVGRLGEGPR